MPNIKPVSDLRNYNEVLKDISNGDPVYLTKNGRGKYAILDIEEYEKIKSKIEILSKLLEAEKAIENPDNWISEEELKKSLGL